MPAPGDVRMSERASDNPDSRMLNCGSISGMTNRIEQIEDAGRAFTVAQVGEGPPGPDRCVCMLRRGNHGRVEHDGLAHLGTIDAHRDALGVQGEILSSAGATLASCCHGIARKWRHGFDNAKAAAHDVRPARSRHGLALRTASTVAPLPRLRARDNGLDSPVGSPSCRTAG